MKLEELRKRIHDISTGRTTKMLKDRKDFEKVVYGVIQNLLPLVNDARLARAKYELSPSIPNGAYRADTKGKLEAAITDAREFVWEKYHPLFSDTITPEQVERIFNETLGVILPDEV